MANRTRAWLIATAILIALLAVAYWRIEWAEKQVDIGFSEEAGRNDFLAAEFFLRGQGVETETVTGMGLLDALPSTDDVLLLSAPRESLSERRRDSLLQWVHEGGTLFVVAHSVYDVETQASADPLLDELGVFLLGPSEEETDEESEEETDEESEEETDEESEEETDEESDEEIEEETGEGLDDEVDEELDEQTASESGDDATDPGSESVAQIEAPSPTPDEIASEEVAVPEGDPPEDEDVSPSTLAELLEQSLDPALCRIGLDRLTEVSTSTVGPLHLELDGSNELAVHEEQLEAAYFSSRAQMASLPVGEGQVIAVTSINPFRNRRIHCHDHAFFLWYVAEGHAKVWLLHDPDVPSLANLAWRELPVSSAGGLLLVVLWVASASLRFGLAPATDEAPRRELREHLEASVTFHFRKGGFAALFVRLRKDLNRRSPHDHERWARRAGVSQEVVEHALVETVPWNRREIVKRIQAMLRMRRTR